MRRTIFFAVLVVAAAGLFGVFATQAVAFPSATTVCSACHSGGGVGVTAIEASNNGVTAVYNVTVTGGTSWAAFDGATRVAGDASATGQFAATVGRTYVVYGVDGPTETDGIAETSVSPVAPVSDGTAPTTTSNAAGPYVGSASITLSASDNVGGSGVAHTYYTLDNVGGAGIEGTVIAVGTVGSHTIEFWSVDVAGNVETPRKSATFVITAPPVSDGTAPTTTSNAAGPYAGSALITLSASDNVGGSGVAHTYYTLDNVGGTGIEGTVIAVGTVGTHTIEFWSVDVAGNVETRNSATFTVTPVPDNTAPTTTSNAQASYYGAATIVLTATDNLGGSGVAHTYHTIDSIGGTGIEGATFDVAGLGTHTIEFWSVDASSNVEARKSATFTITDAPPAPVPTSISIFASATSVYRWHPFVLTGVLSPGAAGDRVVVEVRRPGRVRWSYTSARLAYASDGLGGGKWWFRYTPIVRGTYAFRVRFLGDSGRAASVSRVVYVRIR